MKKIIFFVVLSLCTSVFGQNWTGNINSDWNNPSNWSASPGNGAAIVIDPIYYLGTMSSPIISTNSNFNPATVLVQNGGNLVVSANLTTSDNVEVLNPNSKLTVNNGNFNINVANGGRFIADFGGEIEINGGNVLVGERFISGADAVITVNGGVATTNERLLMDLGGKIILNNGTINVGAVMALADGELANSAYYEQNGGTLNVTGDVALENEAGNFEPTFKMTGGTFNLNGNLVWFGAAPGDGTPKVKLIGGTSNINGNFLNLAGSTVNMHLTISDSAYVQFNGTLIDQIQATDSIKQIGTGRFSINSNMTWSNLGVFIAENSTTNFNGNTVLNGTGMYQFHTVAIESNKTLNHVLPQNIFISGNFNNNGNFLAQTNNSVFNGNQSQFISGLNTSNFYNLVISNSSNMGIYLDTSIFVAGNLNLIDSYVFSSLSDKITLLDNATSSEGSDSSFVNGPITKVGNDLFTFPLGKNGEWRRLKMSAPANILSSFSAEYFLNASPFQANLNAPLGAVSNIEYWTLNRNIGTDQVMLDLYWENSVESGILDCNELAFASYDGTNWNQIPATIVSSCLSNSSGTINSQNLVSDYGIYSFGNLGNITVNNLTICEGSSVIVGSNTYSQTGNYTDVFIGSNNEDSTIITNLTVQQAQTINQTISLCPGESYMINGNTYLATGIYTDVMQSIFGCDSTVVTTIILNVEYQINNPQTICQGETYSINGNNYISAGTYTDVLQTVNGCDSIVSTILTENQTYNVNNPQTICQGETYTINGNNYTIGGTYTDVFQTINGCDSIVSTILTVNQTYEVNNPQTICQGESYNINGNNYTIAGTYTDIFQSINGCDSSIVTILTVQNVVLDLNVSVLNGVFTSVENNANYQWINCLTNTEISGETNQIYSALQNGEYAVILSSLTCNVVDTSSCLILNSLDVKKLIETNFTVKLFPNPAEDKIHVIFDKMDSDVIFSLCDLNGKNILNLDLINKENEIDISELESGFYYIKIDSIDESKSFKIIKK